MCPNYRYLIISTDNGYKESLRVLYSIIKPDGIVFDNNNYNQIFDFFEKINKVKKNYLTVTLKLFLLKIKI